MGYWYVFPETPIGKSKEYNFFAEGEADQTPLEEFDNNVCHSNVEVRNMLFLYSF